MDSYDAEESRLYWESVHSIQTAQANRRTSALNAISRGIDERRTLIEVPDAQLEAWVRASGYVDRDYGRWENEHGR